MEKKATATCACHGHAEHKPHEESHQHDHDDDHDCACHGGHSDAESPINRATILTACALACFISAYVLSHYAGAMWGNAAFIAAYLLCGTGVLRAAWKGILKKKPFNESFLMSLATLGAFAIGDIAEAAGVMIFYSIGEALQDYAVHKSRGSIRSLLALKPDKVRLIGGDGSQTLTEPDSVPTGSLIEVRPGERVPLDCRVESGESSVNTAAMTGESLPRDVSPGDEVLAGFINGGGLLTLNVLRPASESALSRILSRVDEAAKNKAPSEKFITRFARVYTPIVVLAAALVAAVPPLIGLWSFQDSLYRGLLFLVVSCPCALVLSVPLSFFAGLGSASKHGLLVKGGNYLEMLSKADTFVFDKTGTLTEGVFEVTGIFPREGFTKEELLKKAATCEARSSHPLAVSIVSAANGTDTAAYSEYSDIPGEGVICAEESGVSIACGNDRLMRRVRAEGFADIAASGQPTVHVAIDGRYAGYIEARDRMRPEAREALESLRELGISRMAMLSGDTEGAVKAIAGELSIDEYHSRLLPEDKIDRINDIQKGASGITVFVGDGINDAPVLSCADIGMAMGGIGSEAAIEAADIVAMGDRLEALPKAVMLARRTMRIVRQNVGLALGLKVLVLILGVMGLAGMWGAIFADVGVALLCVLNSLRLMRRVSPAT